MKWNDKPCKNFKRYKAKRRPTCGCWPCMAKFMDAYTHSIIVELDKLGLLVPSIIKVVPEENI